MRFTTVVSLLFACWALLSGSPAVYAAPVPSPDGSTGVKRCSMAECRNTVVQPGTDTSTPSQSTAVQNLVTVLINALQAYQTEATPSNTTTTAVDLTTPDMPTPDGGEPVLDDLLGGSDVAA